MDRSYEWIMVYLRFLSIADVKTVSHRRDLVVADVWSLARIASTFGLDDGTDPRNPEHPVEELIEIWLDGSKCLNDSRAGIWR